MPKVMQWVNGLKRNEEVSGFTSVRIKKIFRLLVLQILHCKYYFIGNNVDYIVHISHGTPLLRGVEW